MDKKIRSLKPEEQLYQNRIKEVIEYYLRNYYPSRFDIIKAKALFAWDEKIATANTLWDTPLSIHRSWLIDSIHDTFTKELLNQNYTPQTLPMHPSLRSKSNEAQTYYDWAYTWSWFEDDVSEKLLTEANLIWDSYVFFWKKESFWKDIPSAEHISFFEMFLEPMSTNFETWRIKIVRKIYSTGDVLDKYSKIINFNKKTIIDWVKDSEAIIETYSNCIYKTDFKKIYDIASYESKYIEEVNNCCNWVDWDFRAKYMEILENWSLYESIFWFSEDNKLHEVIEIWEKKWNKHIPKIMINWYLFDLISDVEFEYCPFANVYFEESIGSPVHRWIWHKLWNKQRQCDMYEFIINNGVKMHAFPDWITDWGIKDSDEKLVKNLLWTWEQKVYQNSNKAIQGKQPFRPIDYIDQNILNLVRIRLQETEAWAYQDVWMNSYMSWWDWRIERVRSLWEQRIEQSRARLKTIKKSIAYALTKSYYIWLDILDKSFSKNMLEKIDADGNIELEDLDIKSIKNSFQVVLASEWQRQDSLNTQWQNILNTLNAFWEFIVSDPTLEFDKKQLAEAVASNNGVEWLKFLTAEERIEKKRKETDVMVQLAKIELEWQLEIERMKQELMPQQPAQWQPVQQPEFIETDDEGNVIPPQIQNIV